MRTAILTVTLLLAACSGAPSIIVSNPGAISPAELRTFDFRSSEAVLAAGHRARHSDADMAAAVARQLSAKGYETAATGAAPDFVMTYRSASSEDVRVLAEDRFAPAAPSGLVAVQEGAAIRLFWNPGAERDLRGYRVYARTRGGEWRRIGPDPVLEPSLLDRDVRPGDRIGTA